MRLVGEPALDELSALAARDPRRLIDLLDRQRAVVAVRTCDLVRPAIDHHVQYVLPHNKGFLVHARVLSFRPLRTLNRKEHPRARSTRRAPIRSPPRPPATTLLRRARLAAAAPRAATAEAPAAVAVRRHPP